MIATWKWARTILLALAVGLATAKAIDLLRQHETRSAQEAR
jgi:hypothetical protein